MTTVPQSIHITSRQLHVPIAQFITCSERNAFYVVIDHPDEIMFPVRRQYILEKKIETLPCFENETSVRMTINGVRLSTKREWYTSTSSDTNTDTSSDTDDLFMIGNEIDVRFYDGLVMTSWISDWASYIAPISYVSLQEQEKKVHFINSKRDEMVDVLTKVEKIEASIDKELFLSLQTDIRGICEQIDMIMKSKEITCFETGTLIDLTYEQLHMMKAYDYLLTDSIQSNYNEIETYRNTVIDDSWLDQYASHHHVALSTKPKTSSHVWLWIGLLCLIISCFVYVYRKKNIQNGK